MKKILIAALGALVLFFVSNLVIVKKSFTELWNRYLVVSVPMSKADAIIVLGGEPIARPKLAADLYRAGVAPLVFITGIGDASQNKHVLMEAGVPASAIMMESKATTTYTNATLLKPLLDRAHIKSAVIATSPFHTRRALATFRKVMPNVNFGIESASIAWWSTPDGKKEQNRYAVVELLKTVEYWLIHGVSPFGKGEGGERNSTPEPSRWEAARKSTAEP